MSWRYRIFDHAGIPLEDVTKESVIDREWKLSGSSNGTARFFTEELFDNGKYTFENMKPGNMILAESAHLPDWAGRMAIPFELKPGLLETDVNDPKELLRERYIAAPQPKIMPAFGLVRLILEHASLPEPLPIIADEADLDGDGPMVPRIIQDAQDCKSALDALAEQTGYTWWLEPEVSNGALRYRLNWQPRRESQGIPVMMGKNATLDKLLIGGTLTTAVLIVGKTGNDGQVPKRLYRFEDAIDIYGLRIEKGGLNISAPTGAAFAQALKRKEEDAGKLTYRIAFDALPDEDSDLTKSLAPGSIHEVLIPDFWAADGRKGIRERFRVVALGYEEGKGAVAVAAESI